MIIKELLPVSKLKQITTTKKRVYETPGGTYPSVTTVIGAYFGTEALDKWRDRIGHEEAERISHQAREQGNAVHKLIEDFLLDRKSGKVFPHYKHLFLKAKPFLEKNISKIYGIELPIWSDELCAAGTIDLCAEYQNRFITITDFKTARKKIDNDSDKLLKYKIQTTTYAMMVKERYGIEVPYGVVITLIPEEIEPQIFIIKVKDYEDKVKDIFNWAKLHFGS